MASESTPARPARQAPEDQETLTVTEHGDRMFPYAEKGRVVDGERMPHPERWKHAAAAALHGWPQHAHHMAAEMKLTADDYAKAIEAACKLDAKGIPHPHKPAQFVLAKKD